MSYYKYIPKLNPQREDIVKTLYGCEAYFYKVCGFCERKGKYLTVKQMKKHECLQKQCKCFVKVDHPLWTHRENIKKIK